MQRGITLDIVERTHDQELDEYINHIIDREGCSFADAAQSVFDDYWDGGLAIDLCEALEREILNDGVIAAEFERRMMVEELTDQFLNTASKGRLAIESQEKAQSNDMEESRCESRAQT